MRGTKADVVAEALSNIPLEKRQLAEEITLDLSPSMRSIVMRSFPKTKRTIDRFHIQQLASDAIQEIRIGHRWEALKADHKRKLGAPDTGEILPPEIFPNGDSRPQLLARSRYLLFKSYEKWTDFQKIRAKILFHEYPDIKLVYAWQNICGKSSANAASALLLPRDWSNGIMMLRKQASTPSKSSQEHSLITSIKYSTSLTIGQPMLPQKPSMPKSSPSELYSEG